MVGWGPQQRGWGGFGEVGPSPPPRGTSEVSCALLGSTIGVCWCLLGSIGVFWGLLGIY